MRISALPWALALTACLAIPAGADTIRFGNDAAATVYSCPFDVGVQHGIFQARGLTIEAATFAGAAKAQPALIGGNLDILLGAGSEMAFIVKGAPELTVAVVAGSPNSMALIVGAQSSIQTLGALRGHKLGFTNTGGLTDWLARQVIEREHIPPGAITLVAAGTTPTEVAMLRIGQLDAAILDTVLAHNLEAGGQARILQMFGPYVPDFASMVLFAHRDLIAAHPETIRAFLARLVRSPGAFPERYQCRRRLRRRQNQGSRGDRPSRYGGSSQRLHHRWPVSSFLNAGSREKPRRNWGSVRTAGHVQAVFRGVSPQALKEAVLF